MNYGFSLSVAKYHNYLYTTTVGGREGEREREKESESVRVHVCVGA